MFAKREDWQGLERSELLKFFNDCGHFPTQQQIDEVWDLVHKSEWFPISCLLLPYCVFPFPPFLPPLFFPSFSYLI